MSPPNIETAPVESAGRLQKRVRCGRLNSNGVSKNLSDFQAWCRILEAVAKQREELDQRIVFEDIADLTLVRDCRVWLDLVHGLADLLEERRSAA